MELEGEFSPEPLHILGKRDVKLWKRIVVQLKLQWKHFEVDEATSQNEGTMSKDYPTLFHDSIQSP